MMDTFTVRDLRERTGALIQGAEKGKLALVTKRGRPIFLAVPFSEQLLELGLPMALATSLYLEGIFTLEKAAKLAGEPLESFIEKLGKLGISIVNYSPDELSKEIDNLDDSK